MSSLEQNSLDKRQSPQDFWRSIGELDQSEEVLEQLQQEFGFVDSLAPRGLSRRQFTRLMAASLALAGVGVTGCRRWPEQYLRPQSERPENFLPGVAEFFATQFELRGVATGILAKCVDGRPIKIEGNRLHPFSAGASGPFAQASILELYDPDRTRGFINRSKNSSRPLEPPAADAGFPPPTRHSRAAFESELTPLFASHQQRQGRGLYVLSQSNSSPTLNRLRQRFQSVFPEASWHVYQPVDYDCEFEGSRIAFDRVVRPQFQLDKARVMVTFDADLLGTHPGHQKWCRDWAATRNPDGPGYSRLWSFESHYSITGAAADIRHAVRPSQVRLLVLALAAELGLASNSVPLESHWQARIAQLATELTQAGPSSLLVAGHSQEADVHAWIHRINHHLNCVGSTITYTEEPRADELTSIESLSKLTESLQDQSVETLLILGGNPVYDSPVNLKLDWDRQRPITSIHLGLFENETSRQCTWHAPAAHFLECWSDGRGWDGTYGVSQPMIYPLFDGISEIELISLTLGEPIENGMAAVRETAELQFGVATEKSWRRLLHDGVMAQSQFQQVDVSPVAFTQLDVPELDDGFEICFVEDASVFDGRFGNNSWLQELPDPLTKLTWGNAALISTQDADRLKLADGDEISISVQSKYNLDGIPVLILPGHAPGVLTLPLGYGRQTGHIGRGVGVDVSPLRTAQGRYATSGAMVGKTGKRVELACTQEHHLVDAVGRKGRRKRVGERGQPGLLVRETTLAAHRRDPHQVHSGGHPAAEAPLFDPPNSFDSPCRWGMAIDLNRCVGCNACVVACQSENNVPVVGKANVLQHREMHWLRIDRYFKGDVSAPDVVHVPMACAHCQDAPCEQVCPVAATVHDTEGLNAMVYNRCVGTRYCANNCPYKVRRFNFFDYHASHPKAPARPWLDIPDRQAAREISELQQMGLNPEVTVRMRGVMEKCTYCVQRISQARIHARNQFAKGKRSSNLPQDGEVITACQQACPTQAITFGDLNDPESQVAQAHADHRAYAMLEETNIKPRTRFLARVRNNDAIEAATEEVDHDHP